jgi:sugar/nucleoside kinase (ribokinase family)
VERNSDVIVAGDIYIDLILSGFTSLPELGKEVFATGLRREIGAGTSITACGLAKLGLAVEAIAVVGHDIGNWVVDELRRVRVSTDRIVFHPSEPTALSVVATTPSDRAFFSYPGANWGFASHFARLSNAGSLNRTRHLHLAYAPDLGSAAKLFQTLRESGPTLSLDVGWHEDWLSDHRALSALSLLDLFFPNEAEARRITGESDPLKMLQVFETAGLKCVALKLGPNGAALLHNGEILFGPAISVDPVDTTGAGDCFDAGFLYAWLNGESPQVCLQIANICAALSTEAYGGIAGFPAAERLRTELAKG